MVEGTAGAKQSREFLLVGLYGIPFGAIIGGIAQAGRTEIIVGGLFAFVSAALGWKLTTARRVSFLRGLAAGVIASVTFTALAGCYVGSIGLGTGAPPDPTVKGAVSALFFLIVGVPIYLPLGLTLASVYYLLRKAIRR